MSSPIDNNKYYYATDSNSGIKYPLKFVNMRPTNNPLVFHYDTLNLNTGKIGQFHSSASDNLRGKFIFNPTHRYPSSTSISIELKPVNVNDRDDRDEYYYLPNAPPRPIKNIKPIQQPIQQSIQINTASIPKQNNKDKYNIHSPDGAVISIGPSLRATGITSDNFAFVDGKLCYQPSVITKKPEKKYKINKHKRELRNRTYTSNIKQLI